jgi:acetylglutamate kinase
LKVLVKVGGSLLDEATSRLNVAAQIVEVARQYETVVVHGGGKQLTRFLDSQGIKSAFVNGMRVSDAAVIDGVMKIIGGSVNKSFVAALLAAGEAAVGLSGIDGLLTSAVQLAPEMEFVGRPIKTDARLLALLVNSGYLPVIACLAGDSRGVVFNVNADQMAVSCAAGWHAHKLIFLTDVPGVRNANGEVAQLLNPGEIVQLIESGVAHGGMQAKLEASMLALGLGIEEVIIAPGSQEKICQRLLAGEIVGTRLCATAETAVDA